MEYSVCASALFGGVPVHEAARRIHALGFSAFEFWSWWDQDVDAVAAAIGETGLKLAAVCTRMVPLNVPGRREEYIGGLRESVAVAQRLGCPRLISQVGQAVEGVSRQAQHDSIVEGLRACAPILEDAGIELVVEPLNTRVDHKGYYLDRSDEAFQIIRETGSRNVRVLFDIYHQQVTEGSLIGNLTKNVALVGHIHIAGCPGRREPYADSEIHYPSVLRALKAAGYEGFAGLEYFPLKNPEESLREVLARMPL